VLVEWKQAIMQYTWYETIFTKNRNNIILKTMEGQASEITQKVE
jgi:uncharacterized protein involved in tolerance to divalent cations